MLIFFFGKGETEKEQIDLIRSENAMSITFQMWCSSEENKDIHFFEDPST